MTGAALSFAAGVLLLQQQAILPKVAAGEMLLALAHDEAGSRYELDCVATSARRQGDHYALTGAKTVVLHGAQADTLVVSARTAGKPRDAGGISLFLVDRKAAGVGVRDYPTHDGQRAAEIAFKNARGELLGKDGQGLALLGRVAETPTVLTSAVRAALAGLRA